MASEQDDKFDSQRPTGFRNKLTQFRAKLSSLQPRPSVKQSQQSQNPRRRQHFPVVFVVVGKDIPPCDALSPVDHVSLFSVPTTAPDPTPSLRKSLSFPPNTEITKPSLPLVTKNSPAIPSRSTTTTPATSTTPITNLSFTSSYEPPIPTPSPDLKRPTNSTPFRPHSPAPRKQQFIESELPSSPRALLDMIRTEHNKFNAKDRMLFGDDGYFGLPSTPTSHQPTSHRRTSPSNHPPLAVKRTTSITSSISTPKRSTTMPTSDISEETSTTTVHDSLPSLLASRSEVSLWTVQSLPDPVSFFPRSGELSSFSHSSVSSSGTSQTTNSAGGLPALASPLSRMRGRFNSCPSPSTPSSSSSNHRQNSSDSNHGLSPLIDDIISHNHNGDHNSNNTNNNTNTQTQSLHSSLSTQSSNRSHSDETSSVHHDDIGGPIVIPRPPRPSSNRSTSQSSKHKQFIQLQSQQPTSKRTSSPLVQERRLS